MNEKEWVGTAQEEASGYMLNESERINSEFSDISIINLSEYYFIAKGLRYGKWFILKGINQKYVKNESVIALLRKEFDLLLEMDHPYIRKVIGFEMVQPIGPAIIMEYIEGTTLSKWLAEGHSLTERYRIANEILEALSYIHRKEVVHRDIKPENIIITRIGERVKIIDFGLSDSDSYALFKNPAGTENYISAEQKSSSVPNPSNDIYSCGKVFQKLLPEIRFRRVLNECLKDASKRPQNVKVLKAKLQRAYRGPKRLLFLALFFVVIISILLIGPIKSEQNSNRGVAGVQTENVPEESKPSVGVNDNTDETVVQEDNKESLDYIHAEARSQDATLDIEPIIKPDIKPDIKPTQSANKLTQDSFPVKSEGKINASKEKTPARLSNKESVSYFLDNGKRALEMVFESECQKISDAKKAGNEVPIDNSFPQSFMNLKISYLEGLVYHINFNQDFNNKYDFKITDIPYVESELDKYIEKLNKEWKTVIRQKK